MGKRDWIKPELEKVSLKAATFGNGTSGGDVCALRAPGNVQTGGCS